MGHLVTPRVTPNLHIFKNALEAEAYKGIYLNCAIKILSPCDQMSLVVFIDHCLVAICKIICRNYQLLFLFKKR